MTLEHDVTYLSPAVESTCVRGLGESLRVVEEPSSQSDRILPPEDELQKEGWSEYDRYLSEEYLAGYFKNIPEREHYQQIPFLVRSILAPVFTSDYVENAFGTGSISKCMTRGEMPSLFWEMAEYFREEFVRFKDKYEEMRAKSPVDPEFEEDAKFVLKTLDYLSTGPADSDFKVIPHHQYRQKFGEIVVTQALDVNINDYELKEVGKDGEGNLLYRPFYTVNSDQFGVDGFNIVADFGQIGTNPNRQRVQIVFFDRESGEEAYKIHIGYFPFEVEEAWLDRRSGYNSDWQDFGTTDIFSDGSRLWYRLRDEAVEVMHRKNQIPEPREIRPLDMFVENSLRTHRDNSILLHGEDTNLAGWYPDLDTASLFGMRWNTLYWWDKGQRISPNKLKIAVREIFLTIARDPFKFVKLLETTGIAVLFPGFADKSDRFWRQVLYSKAFSKALEGPRGVSRTDKNYLQKQRCAYQDKMERGEFLGRDMLLAAIDEVEGRDTQFTMFPEMNWLRLYRLLKYGGKKLTRVTPIEPDERLDKVVHVGRIPVKEGVEFVGSLMGPNVPADPGEQRRLAREGAIYFARGEAPETVRLEEDSWQEALDWIRSRQNKISIQIHSRYVDFDDVFAEDVAKDIFDVLYKAPFALTAREILFLIAENYFEKNNIVEEEAKQEFIQKYDPIFTRQFLVLKLAGLIERNITTREEGKFKVDLYSLRGSRELTEASQVEDTDSYKRSYNEVTGFGRNQTPRRFNNAFQRAGISVPLEVMGTLTAEDFKIMIRGGAIHNIGKSARDCERHARFLYEAFEKYKREKR